VEERAEVQDRSHVPPRLSTTMTAWEAALAVELCRSKTPARGAEPAAQ